MSDKFTVRGGVPREIIYGGMELDPAEGATMTYRLSGRSGPVRLSGNGTHYSESNPHAGRVQQDISVTTDQFKSLAAIQSERAFRSVTVTTAGNDVLDGNMAIGNEEAIENNNGVVSLELVGQLRPR